MKKVNSKWLMAIFAILGIMILTFLVFATQYWDSVSVFSHSPDEIAWVMTNWINPPRGNIYDRNRKQLTDYKVMYKLGVNLKQVESRETIAKVLSTAYGYDYLAVMNAINVPYKRYLSEYVELGSFFTKEELSTLKKWKSLTPNQLASRLKDYEIQINPSTKPSLKGLTWKAYKVRYYPNQSTAANILGFYNIWGGSTAKGYYGIEGYYNDMLDSGSDIYLTIDLDLQSRVETQLDEAVSASQAEAGSVLVMDANSGEILVMATSERIDPNHYWTIFQDLSISTPYNPLISSMYEPDSIFGLFTMAIAIEEGVVDSNATFIDTGKYDKGGVTYTNRQQHINNEITMSECLTLPSNVCLIWLADHVGENDYYDYLQKLGFNQPTNIDLEAEFNFPLMLPGSVQWNPATIAANAFGQSIALTPIQLVTAASSLTGQKDIVVPRVVSSIRTGFKESMIPAKFNENPISEVSIQELNQIMLEMGLEKSDRSNINEQPFVGIFGIAQVVGDNGSKIGYLEDVFNQAFLGWGQVEEKQLIMLVWLENIRIDNKSKSNIEIFANQVLQDLMRKP